MDLAAAIGDEDAVTIALQAAAEGVRLGEMPIGAAVFLGKRLVASAWTQERAQRRRIVHAGGLTPDGSVLPSNRRLHCTPWTPSGQVICGVIARTSTRSEGAQG